MPKWGKHGGFGGKSEGSKKIFAGYAGKHTSVKFERTPFPDRAAKLLKAIRDPNPRNTAARGEARRILHGLINDRAANLKRNKSQLLESQAKGNEHLAKLKAIEIDMLRLEIVKALFSGARATGPEIKELMEKIKQVS